MSCGHRIDAESETGAAEPGHTSPSPGGSPLLAHGSVPGPVAQSLIALIRIYQRTLSPLLGPSCRFEPSCSRYAASCLSTHGSLRGSWLAVRRILRCHPFHPGGFDPPPPALTPGRTTPPHSLPPASGD